MRQRAEGGSGHFITHSVCRSVFPSVCLFLSVGMSVCLSVWCILEAMRNTSTSGTQVVESLGGGGGGRGGGGRGREAWGVSAWEPGRLLKLSRVVLICLL